MSVSPAPSEIAVVEVLVIGLTAVGKSTFIRTLSMENGGHSEQDADGWFMTTLPVDDSVMVTFLEPPASRHFNFLWMRELISSVDVPGYIVLFDSTAPELFGEAISILQMIRAYHDTTPCLVVANKQDDLYAWSAEDIRIGLGIPNDISVVPCVASDSIMVREAVLQLLYRIFEA